MDRLYFKIVEASTELARNANYLAMNANYRDDIDQATCPILPQIYEAVSNARKVIEVALIRQRMTDPVVRDNLINRQQS